MTIDGGGLLNVSANTIPPHPPPSSSALTRYEWICRLTNNAVFLLRNSAKISKELDLTNIAGWDLEAFRKF